VSLFRSPAAAIHRDREKARERRVHRNGRRPFRGGSSGDRPVRFVGPEHRRFL